MIHRCVPCDIEHERRLSHGRTRSKDYKVGRLPSESDLVKRREARRHTAQTRGVLKSLNVIDGFGDDGPDILDILFDIVLDSRKYICLRIVYQVIHIGSVIVR